MRPGDWNCPNCNVVIFASKPSCRKCGATNPSATSASNPGRGGGGRGNAAASSAAAAPATSSPSSSSATWLCNNQLCGSINDDDSKNRNQSCARCGVSKGQDGIIIAEATAVAVSNQQQPQQQHNRGRQTQQGAQQQQPQQQGFPRTADWPCCGNTVFGSKPRCLKCGAPNPHLVKLGLLRS